MTSELSQQPLTPEELAQRQKKVRNVVLLCAYPCFARCTVSEEVKAGSIGK